MPTRKPRRKSGGHRYGDAASKSVESAMRRRKNGAVGSAQEGREGSEPKLFAPLDLEHTAMPARSRSKPGARFFFSSRR